MWRHLSWVLVCLGTTWAMAKGWAPSGWTPQKWFQTPHSSRLANYRVKATLDWPTKCLSGQLQLTWRNGGTAPTSDFPLHLYMNAFKGPQTCYMREGGWKRYLAKGDTHYLGYCRLLGVSLDGVALAGKVGEDETVYWVKLPRPVAPGQSITVNIAWETQFPRIMVRAGYEEHFLMGAQWFPKVGVYQGAAWQCNAYHYSTEFFSDFGVYDVDLSLSNHLLPAFTGTCLPQQAADGRWLDALPDPTRAGHCRYLAHAEDVHDFAWAVMPRSEWQYRKFDYRGVQIYYFCQGAHRALFDRQHEALKAALRGSAELMFPYPYPALTIVDAPASAHWADGMEYPTLFLASSKPFDPAEERSVPEEITIHEFAHQYFQGMIASNEATEAWLDEGLTTWFTHRTLREQGQSLFASRRFSSGSDMGEWKRYWTDPSVDPITNEPARMRDSASYFRSSYAKSFLALLQLEAMLGRPVMEKAVQAYAREMAFQHPTGRDFWRILERVAGRDLSGFWQNYMVGTDTLDYVISRVETVPIWQGGWTEGAKGPVLQPTQAGFPEGRVHLSRRGGICAPMTLWVRLANKQEQRINWDGQARWATFDFPSPVVAAVLDPDQQYPLLKDRLHASYRTHPVKRGFHYWSQLVVGLLTGILQSVGLG